MNVHWKELGQRAHPRRWTGTVWSVVLLVVVCSVGTAIVGMKLVEAADRQQIQFNTQ